MTNSLPVVFNCLDTEAFQRLDTHLTLQTKITTALKALQVERYENGVYILDLICPTMQLCITKEQDVIKINGVVEEEFYEDTPYTIEQTEKMLHVDLGLFYKNGLLNGKYGHLYMEQGVGDKEQELEVWIEGVTHYNLNTQNAFELEEKYKKVLEICTTQKHKLNDKDLKGLRKMLNNAYRHGWYPFLEEIVVDTDKFNRYDFVVNIEKDEDLYLFLMLEVGVDILDEFYEDGAKKFKRQIAYFKDKIL